MTTPYLLEKWRKAFEMFDFNHDNVLTIADAHIFADNTVKGYKLKGKVAEEIRKNYIYIYKTVFLGSDCETAESFIERFKQMYNEERSKFEDKMKEWLAVLIQSMDRNGDGVISKDEHRASCQASGLNSFVERFYGALPPSDEDTISSDDFTKCLFEYYCNNDKTNVSPYEKAACIGHGVRSDI